jgi:hypothetical protein
VLVAVVAVGLVVGPAGAAVAAPDRGEGARPSGWLADVKDWVLGAWVGWLSGHQSQDGDESSNGDDKLPEAEDTTCGSCSDGGAGLDPDG